MIEIELSEAVDKSPVWRYSLEFQQESTGKHPAYVSAEKVIFLPENKTVLNRPDKNDQEDKRLLSQTALEQIAQNAQFRDIPDFLSDILYLHLVPQLLKFGNELAAKRMTNDPFGQGFLESIASTPEKISNLRLKRIEGILKEVLHGMSDLKFERDEMGRPHLKMRYSHWRPNSRWQTEEEFSDGTLRMLAILWTILANNSVILFEEPELSLHQTIVERLPELIQRARISKKKANSQIFISTHSTALLNSPVIKGQYLVLEVSDNEEGTAVSVPSAQEELALQSGVSPADILLPKTAKNMNIRECFNV